MRETIKKRKRYRHSNIVTFKSVEEAEREALMLVIRHPDWMGKLEVRRATWSEYK
jgi:hypothetical protein